MSWKRFPSLLGSCWFSPRLWRPTICFRRETGLNVNAEALRSRDLEAIVSASGKIQPKRQVNVSANTTGRVRVSRSKKDSASRPVSFFSRSIHAHSTHSCSAAKRASPPPSPRSSRHAAVQQTRVALDLARQNLKRTQELWKEGLTTRESLERAENDVSGARG